MSKDMFSSGQVAKFCGVSKNTVLSWIKDKKLKAFKLPFGEHYRVVKEDLILFFRENNIPIPNDIKENSGKKRILIIDDDKNFVAGLIRLFKDDNIFEVEGAYSGFEGGLRIKDFDPDLVVCDVKMKGISGFEVLEKIKGDDSTKHIKVVIISGMVNQIEIDKLKELGADSFLEKPFTHKELLQEIEELLTI